MKKKTVIRLISFSAAAVLCLGIVAFRGIKKNRQFEYYRKANAQKAFSELVSDIDELSFDLEKSVYITDAGLQSELCTKIYGKALEAQMALGMLPYESQQIEQAAGYVSKVGDYACVLSSNVTENNGYTDEEFENLQSLSEIGAVLADNLRELQMQLANGTMVMDLKSDDKSNEGNAVLLSDAIFDIEGEFPELPTLIYDGPFSDALSQKEAAMLKDKEEVSQIRASEIAAEFLDIGVGSIEDAGECGGDIPLWCFKANLNGNAYHVSITKVGGLVWTVYSEHTASEAKYSVQEAQKIAEAVLVKQGIEHMEASYHIIQNGCVLFNFEYTQNDVTCYADLIKIVIALDNGALQRYDASAYIENHCSRTIERAQISEADAAANISQYLKVEELSLALIPTDGGDETLCYELLCRNKEEEQCLIYVNAETGKQEKILILIEDDNGTLTI